MAQAPTTKQTLSPGEARAIAKDAYIYGFPIVDSYRIQHSYFVDQGGPQYKTSWNQIYNNARVYTPDDTSIQTPNSDTPYSYIGADLRGEPIVLTIPSIEKGRYFSLQFIDAYTFNFAYVGSRATGNDGGSFLLVGPRWMGEPPSGIKQVIRSETDFVLVFYRTQLFSPADIENVKKIQAGYKVQPLSSFLSKPMPPAQPQIDFMQPLSVEAERNDPRFFELLNFELKFCPTHPSEKELMARFAKLGIGPDGNFNAEKLPSDILQALKDGMADAWAAFETFKTQEIDTGKTSSAEGFGSREFLKNDYMKRMAAAALGIYGNSKEEAIYPVYFLDSSGGKLDAKLNRYSLHFAQEQLPPVNAFWSLTMYKLPSSLLVENPLDRYLINSPMLPSVKRDADGGITLYLQHDSPGKEKEPNWLPAPSGPFFAVLRLYWPKPEALNGQWKQPPLRSAQ